jgi:hypothetical protein
MPVPYAATRAMNERHFNAGATLDSVVEALEAPMKGATS